MLKRYDFYQLYTEQMEREIFLATELLHKSGILVVIFLGIVTKNYVENAWFVLYVMGIPTCLTSSLRYLSWR